MGSEYRVLDMTTFQLKLPPSLNSLQESSVIESSGVIVFIGANGAGKTRMGSWIEFSMTNVHRVAAQKSLTMPDAVSTSSVEKAEHTLFSGYDQTNLDVQSHKINGRWGQRPNTFLLNDYQQLRDSEAVH
jgi:recombinational DNA repair ATPase RecF